MNKSNQKMQFRGATLKVTGREIHDGDKMPNFKLTGNDLGDVTEAKFANKVLILTSVPSLDTPTCAIETKRFNEEASKLGANINILTVSMDLPFAQKRWCAAEGVERVMTASDYKYRTFGENFGVLAQDMGLLARAVFVIDKKGIVKHVEYVAELSAEPNYEAALAAAKAAL